MAIIDAFRTQRSVLLLICAAVLVTILTLGLWPFHAPRNQVAWLANRNGLNFGRYGTVMSAGPLEVRTAAGNQGASLEVWLQPRRTSGGGTIVAFHDSSTPLQFALEQSLTDLEVATRQRGGSVSEHFYVDDTFRRPGPVLISITSGPQGTAVFVQGALARKAPGFRLTANQFAGTLILGDSPGQSDPWSGQLYGVAIYHSELSTSQVLRDYQTWITRGRPQILSDYGNAALYLFDERKGNIVRNQAQAYADLNIPETYYVLDKIALQPVWREFSMTQDYWGSALKNVVGFIPLGICFYAYFSVGRTAKQAALVTVLLGIAVSVTIEVLQAYLPTRDSGTTDIVTNTFGAWLGVWVCPRLLPTLARFMPWLRLPFQAH